MPGCRTLPPMRDSEPQPPPAPQPLGVRALALVALLALLVAGAYSSWAILADRADFDATLDGAADSARTSPAGDANEQGTGLREPGTGH